MSREVVFTSEAPQPVGPYSQAVLCDGWLFCSGQISIDPKSGEIFLGDIQAQTTIVMSNIGAVLKSAQLNYDNIIKTTIFLTDMKDFSAVNEIYSQYFGKQPPARSCVAVAGLPKGVKVEIEVIARK